VKIISLIILIMSTQASLAGVGGAVGGPGSSSWAPALEKGYIRDWPQIRFNKSRTFELHELCIQDDSTLRTLKKYGKLSLFALKVTNKRYQTMERVFDHKSCFGASDPMCAIVDQYVDDEVSVPVYKGQLARTRGGEQTVKEFIRSSRLARFETLKIPKCLTSGN